jgi:hypothetical protein
MLRSRLHTMKLPLKLVPLLIMDFLSEGRLEYFHQLAIVNAYRQIHYQ